MASLFQIPDVLDQGQLRRVRSLLADAPWQDGRGSAGGQAALVKNNDQLPRDWAGAKEIRNTIVQALDRSAMFFSAALPKRLSLIHISEPTRPY